MYCSLKFWNTFGVDKFANDIVCAENIEQIMKVWKDTTENQQSVLIIGEGSNILFVDNFNGTVIVNRIMGIQITENKDAWFLHVGAGENWHQLVKFTIDNNMPGLENLALIPGCVGSSPIQNIGAYGAELSRVCQYVDCIELQTGKFYRLESSFCRFGYRDSIFKHEYQGKYAIIAVGLLLKKRWKPILTYGDLIFLDPSTVKPKQIFNLVCRMRMTKLPNPKINGNAGSFFKNPIISYKTAKELLSQWPNIPHYPHSDGYVRLAAGWLIDQCQLKGVSYGGATVHHRQALVLINEKNATSEDIIHLAHIVRKNVGEKFNIWLEPEVHFINATGEVNTIWKLSNNKAYVL